MTKTKRTSSTPPRRRNRRKAAGTTGYKKRVDKKSFLQIAVGGTVPLAEEHHDLIGGAVASVNQTARALGEVRARFLITEQELIGKLVSAERAYQEAITKVAKKANLNIAPGSPEAWNYDSATRQFTRTG